MLDNILLLAVLAVLILLLLALLYLRHPSCAPQPLRLDRLARDRATTDSLCGVTPFRWARHGTCALCADEARVLVLDGCAHDGLCETCMRGYLTEQAGDATNFPVKCAFHVDGCRSIVSPNVARSEVKRKRKGDAIGHVVQKQRKRDKMAAHPRLGPEDPLEDVFDG